MMSFFAGLGLGLSLIVAIGAQNVFVLRQGIRREHVLAVVIICALSDAVLIVAGVAGLGLLLEQAPWLVVAARWLGAAFLLGYGLLAARRAWRGGTDALQVDADATTGAPASGSSSASSSTAGTSTGGVATSAATALATRPALMPVVLTALALTWLNPHVYLDTVLMLGSIAATHGEARWIFAAGAIAASCLWFTSLGFGARHLGRWLNTPKAWRVLDAIIAVIMIALAVSLLVPVLAG